MNEPQLITSRRAGIISLALSLREKKGRAEHNLCFAEGAVAADYALKMKSAVKGVLLSRDATEKCAKLAHEAAAGSAPFYLLTGECFEKISVLRSPEGLALLVEPAPLLKNASELPDDGPVACLWQLQDPGNLGTIIRSAASFGCRHFLLVKNSVSHLHPLCIRASAGAALDSNFLYLEEDEAMRYLTENKGRVCALSGEGCSIKFDLCYNNSVNMVIVSGNEPHGLPERARKSLPLFSIPTVGSVESLNVTAASAIAYYVFWSQRAPLEK